MEENVWTSRYQRIRKTLTWPTFCSVFLLILASKRKYLFLSFEVNLTIFNYGKILSEQERAIITFKKSV